jgi:hypothetical protein
MKWFDDWFAKKCKEAWENSNRGIKISDRDIEMQKAFAMNQASINKLPSSLALHPSPNTQSINFQIYPAVGGHVVEVHFAEPASYIVNNAVPQKSLHIIPSTEDLGIAISKIITLEMLKK